MRKQETQSNSSELKNKKKGKHLFIYSIATFLNHLAAIALLISYLAPYISPQNFWFIAFFGLAYPLLVVINLLFVVYWGMQLKKRGLYSLVIILLGFNSWHRYVQCTFYNTPNKSKKLIKVMSYNVKAFDLYNWTNNLKTRHKMFELINDESPEIACFQEYFHRDSSKFANTDSLLKFKKFKFYHIKYTSTPGYNQHFGIATFSNYPIINRGEINFGYPSNNACIFSDMLCGKDTLRVYNMHLQSIAFSYDDYKYMDDLQKDLQTEDIEHSKNILKRLKKAFVKRAIQTDIIAANIASSPYPVIVCGDFNDTPSSYAYSILSSHLKDAFIESGNGFGKTYSGIMPSFRIDYILHSGHFKAYRFKTIREKLSDHFPITTYLEKQ